ncbi:homocysteine S-methyltransferase family protein [Aquibaculum sediminis]|uniref:homocysteine S-methyltransferase family protein n=1 Tax=Aquibaculum sediminis TaxID=3231907 RepID=UPI0034534593
MRRLEEALAQRVLLTDGAVSRQLRKQPIDPERDLWGHEGRLELLCLTRPVWVKAVHEAYLRAGADVVRSHTLDASPLSLEDAGLADQAFYLNFVATQIACEAVDSIPGRGRRRFVLGLVRDQGWDASPGELEAAVATQAEGLIAGGADGIALDVTPGTGRASLFLRGAEKARRQLGAMAPLYLQSTPGAVAYSNHVLEQVDGTIIYRNGSRARGDWLTRAVQSEGVNLIGGGDTPEDTAALDRRLRLLADDGLRPLNAAARAAGAHSDESVVPSSALRLDPIITELH